MRSFSSTQRICYCIFIHKSPYIFVCINDKNDNKIYLSATRAASSSDIAIISTKYHLFNLVKDPFINISFIHDYSTVLFKTLVF